MRLDETTYAQVYIGRSVKETAAAAQFYVRDEYTTVGKLERRVSTRIYPLKSTFIFKKRKRQERCPSFLLFLLSLSSIYLFILSRKINNKEIKFKQIIIEWDRKIAICVVYRKENWQHLCDIYRKALEIVSDFVAN